MDRPSRTAQAMALFRALESARPAGRRLFDDPYAIHFLPPLWRAVARVARIEPLGAMARGLLDGFWPGARSAGVARTRFIDDAVTSAVREGVDQVVLLGAGFDSRALRLPELRGIHVFEVDRPATLAAKRARPAARGIPVPSSVVHAAGDLARRPVLEVLSGAGFTAARRAAFVWEGVTNYLDAPAVDSTLRALASCAAGSLVVFTYVHRDALGGGRAFPTAPGIRRAVRRMGEAWTFGLDPAALPAYLAERGLALEEDVSIPECRARLWGPRGASLRGYEFYRIARARVTPGGAGPARAGGGDAPG